MTAVAHFGKRSVALGPWAGKGGPHPREGPCVRIFPPITRRALGWLAEHGALEGPARIPGCIPELARALGVREERVRRLVGKLERLGLLRIERPYRSRGSRGYGRGRAFCYEITEKGRSYLSGDTKTIPVLYKELKAAEEVVPLRRRRTKLQKRLAWHSKPFSERSARLIIMRARVGVENNESLNGTRPLLVKALCASIWRELQEKRPPLMVQVAFASLIEGRLEAWLNALAPVAERGEVPRLFGLARSLVRSALDEAEDGARSERAGLRCQLEHVEARLEALKRAQGDQPDGAPEPPRPSVVVPNELWVAARHKEAYVGEILRALDALKPDGNGKKDGEGRGEAYAGAGGEDLPADGLPPGFLTWLQETRPLTWAVVVRDSKRLGGLWVQWRAAQAQGPLVTPNGSGADPPRLSAS